MTVYKGYLLLMKRNIRVLFLYIVLFLSLTLLIQKFMGDDENLALDGEAQLNVAVIDRSGTKTSEAFTRWLGGHHKLIAMEDDTQALQEAMFYGNLDYIIFLPEDFDTQVLEGETPLSVVEKPGSYQGAFVESQISSYLATVRAGQSAGYTLAEAMDLAADGDAVTADVTVIDRNGHGGETPGYVNMFKYLSYLYVAVLCYCLGTVILLMRRKEIRRRVQCSCVSQTSQNLQTLLACLSAGLFLWLLSLGLIFLCYGGDLVREPHLMLFLANSFLMMLTGLSVAFLVGNVAPTAGVINSIVNVAALGMCFLCGVFVPLSMLSGVKVVSRLLPVYWYVTVTDLLGDYRTLDTAMYREVFTSFGIQLLMAAILVTAGLIVRKKHTYAA